MEVEIVHNTKKPRLMLSGRSDLFDGLPDDIVISILCKLTSTARCPSDFISILLTCTRLNRLGLTPVVLQKAGPNTLAVRAKNWSESAHRFIKLCVSAGNIEALYMLGMIRFYCLQNRRGGGSLMAKAAMTGHAAALYSLAVIQFNGSGGDKNDKDVSAGVALCTRAAQFGHVDSLRELGHCYVDGYGVEKNGDLGRHLLLRANAKDLESLIRSSKHPFSYYLAQLDAIKKEQAKTGIHRCTEAELWSDFGFQVYPREVHPADRFLIEWFELNGSGQENGLRRCSDESCGRAETRMREFRRCSRCGKVNYCSRACQLHDWKVRHKVECPTLQAWYDHNNAVDLNDDGAYQTVQVENGNHAA